VQTAEPLAVDPEPAAPAARRPRGAPDPLAARRGRRRLRICHVLSSLKVGGAERLVLRLAARQRAAGHDVTLLALAPGELAQELPRLGLSAQIVTAASAAERALVCARLFERRRFDVVNSHNPSAHRLGGLARAASAAATIMTIHGSGERPLGFVVRHEWSHALVAVSEHSRAQFLARHAGRRTAPVFVVANGVAPDATPRPRSLVRAELGLRDDQPVIAIVARLDPLKDHETLFDALARAQAPAYGWRLLVVGDGERRQALEADARARGLADVVCFLGFRRDVTDLVAASDVVALSSISEGLPLAPLEAMAVGVPVVATDVGGTREVVDDRVTGRLVPPRAPALLANALRELIEDATMRRTMGRAGRDAVARRFSLDRMAQGYSDIYEQFRSTRRR
jgi:glycosyltransferase involved in cell wall biosynthesis